MTIWFPDLSKYDRDRGVIVRPGTVAVLARATLSTSYADWAYPLYKAEAESLGALFGGYHWINHGNLGAQAAWAYSHVGPGVPLMIDAEDMSGNTGYAGPLTVADLTGFADQYRRLGGTVHLVYLPRWYWSGQMGSPDLRPLTSAGLSLVSSIYTTYSDTGPGWESYGDVTPAIWQYTDALPYSGSSCDFNAFRGSVDELRTLMMGDPMAFLDDPDAAALAWRMDAIMAGADQVRGGPYKGEPMTAVQLLHGIAADLAAVKTAVGSQQPAALTDAQVIAIASQVADEVTAHHDALTEADMPVVQTAAEAAVRRVLGSLGATQPTG